MIEQRLGVSAGDQVPDLVGAVALDHHGRVGLITARRQSAGCGGCWIYVGVVLEPHVGPLHTHWRWTANTPLVIASTLHEYATATDDQLGLEALRSTRPSHT